MIDKESYFEMLEKKDEEILDLKNDIYILEETIELLKKDIVKIKNIIEEIVE